MPHRNRSLNRFAVALALAAVFVAARVGVQMFAAPAATFDTLPNLYFNQGQDVTVAFAANGFPTGLTYTAEGLPAGLSMSMGVDTLGHEVGVLSGTLTPDTPTTSGSEGIYSVRLHASDGAVSNFFSVDVSHWNHGDVFVGAGQWQYQVYRQDGSFKTDITVPDDANITYGSTTGCAVNWRTGEVWATNFDDYYPALNVITRHSGSNPLPYTDPSRRLSTERYGTGNTLTPFPGNIYPFDINPESVAFDNDGNMLVGHSFGYWNDNGDVADANGNAIVLHHPTGEGWVYVDGAGQPLVDGQGNTLFDNTPISPAGFFERWVGNSLQNILDASSNPIPVPQQGGMDLHRYTPDANGNYDQATRQFFDLRYGLTGVDAIDLLSDQKTMLYTSENWYIYRYDVAAGAQLPVLGSSIVGESKPVGGTLYGLRALPPGDGTGGYMVVDQYEIYRLDENGRKIQKYDVKGDPDYLADEELGWLDGDVNGWFSIAIAPDGRTFWAATRQDVFHFDIASGARIGNKIRATIGTLHTNAELAGLCVMAEYRAAQEVCGPTGLGNNIDDDHDGTIDEGCFRVEICSALRPGDDDGDGLVDYNDPDCGAPAASQCVPDGPTDNSVAGICDRADYEGDNVLVPGIPLPCSGDECLVWTFSYSATGLPPGLTMDSMTGAVTGLPFYSIVNPNSELSAPVVYHVTVNSTWTRTGEPPASFSNTFDWTISNRNRNPIAVDDGPQTVVAGASFTFNVRSNDSDIDGDTFTVLSFTQPPTGQGTVTLVGNDLRYTAPTNGFGGTTTFTYRLQDSYETPGVSNDATVTVYVNAPPVANPNAYTTAEDTPLTILVPGILANDTDPNNDPIHVVVATATPASHGTVTLNPSGDGSFVYTPNANFSGTDTFTYQVNDGVLDSNFTTVTITITPADDVPVAVNDAFTTNEDTPVSSTLVGNDTLSGDGGNVWTKLSNPSNGIATVNADGTFSYTPNAGFSGTDTFTYRLCDADGDCSTATVTITILPKALNVTASPVCIADTPYVSFTITAVNFTPVVGATATLKWKDSTGAVVQTTVIPWSNVSQPLTGQMLWPGAAVDTLGNPTDWPGWILQGGLWIQGSDGYENTRPNATVEISVNPTTTISVSYPPATPSCNAAPSVNRAPVAADDAYTTAEDTPVTVPVPGILVNDTDPEGGPLSVVLPILTQPQHGTVTQNTNGSLTYTPAANYTGTDSYTYKVVDAFGNFSNVATVRITITPVNDVPLAVNDTFTTLQSTPVGGTLVTNDTPSGDGGNVWAKTSNPLNGTAAVNANGTFTYTPNPYFFGTDSFNYRVCDVDGDCATATVTITVVCPPVAGTPTALVRRSTMFDAGSRTEGNIQMMTASSATFNSNATLVGDLFMAGTPTVQVNGIPASYGGTVDGTGLVTPSGYYATINSGASLGRIVRRTDPVSLPTVAAPTAPAGTRNVVLNGPSDPIGTWSTLRDLTLNSNTMNVDVPAGNYGTFTANNNTSFTIGVVGASTPAVYNFQSLNMNGSSSLFVVGPVVVTVGNQVGFNAIAGNVSHPEWLTFQIASGGLNLNSTSTRFYGYTVVPNGALIVNSGAKLVGGLAADSLTVNSNAIVMLQALAGGCAVPDAVPTAVNDAFTTAEDTPVSGTLRGNDTPSTDGGNVWTKTSNPSNGAATVNADGTFTYTPNANFFGTDTFTYQVCDADGDCSTATVTITITSVDDAPVAVNDAFTTAEDTPVSGSLTGNDTLSGDGGNVWSKTSNPANGTATVSANGAFTYTPNPNFFGTDSFTYQVCDADGDCSTATVTITITPVNEVPLAVNDDYITPVNTPVSGTAQGNDTPSPDGGNVWSVVTGPTTGTVSFAPTGTFTYTPATGATGSVTFTYKVCDLNGDCSTAVVTITIAATCEAGPFTTYTQGGWGASPNGNNPAKLLQNNFAVVYPAGFVQIGTSARFLKFTTSTAIKNFLPAGGTASTISASATNPTYSSAGVFAGQVLALQLSVDFSEAGIKKRGLKNQVVASGELAGYSVGQVLALANSAIAGGALPSGLTLSELNAIVDAINNNYDNGTSDDHFLNDDPACGAPNAVPVAVSDSYTGNEDVAVTGSLAGNDTASTDGGNVWTLVNAPAHGTVTITTSGNFTYIPTANYSGTDSFDYEVCDTNDDCDSATATITIAPGDDAPIAVNDAYATTAGVALSGNLAANDTASGDGGNVWTRVTNSSNGSATVGTNGTFTFTPASGFAGVTAFTYKVCDADADCSTATVTITVTSVNHAPVAVADAKSVDEGADVTITVLTNDSDPDGDTISVISNTAPAHGSVVRSGNTFLYSASDDYAGTDSFSYTISDGRGSTATATVTITITGCIHGAFTTYTQGGWGATPSGNNPAQFLASNFSGVYGAGYVKVGGTKYLKFTSASAIANFLPAGGTAAKLTANGTNPTTSTGGVFAGQVLALQLSVDFSKAGKTKVGLAALKVKSGKLVGYTVQQVLDLANKVLGGTTSALPSGVSISDLNNIVDAINRNFDNGNTNNGYLG